MRMIGIPKNFIGTRPGRVYSWGGSASIQTASGTVVTFPQSEERAFSGLNVYGHSTQSGTPSPDNPVPIVSAGNNGEINVSVSDGGTQSQTLALSTPGGLPGVPVDSGGNYTDESGQQWICNEIDLKRGKYVQRVGEIELSGTESYTLSENNGRYYYSIESESFTNFPLTTMSDWSTKGLCTHFQYNNPYSFEGDAVVCLNQNGTNKVRIGFADNINDVEYVKSYMLEQKNSGNPVRLYFALETPIETDLPAEEIAAYQALHTYTPNTSVGNDADAWMKVGYVAEE